MERFKLTRIVQESILEGRKPAKVISEEIGKPYSTMLREANPFDTTAKVGIETLIDIMRATENVAPLRYLADLMGYELTPKKSAATAGARPRGHYQLETESFPLGM